MLADTSAESLAERGPDGRRIGKGRQVWPQCWGVGGSAPGILYETSITESRIADPPSEEQVVSLFPSVFRGRACSNFDEKLCFPGGVW